MLKSFFPSRYGVVLRTTAYANVLYPAVWKAATAAPSRISRQIRHPDALAVGAARVADLDAAIAAQEHNLSRPPEGALDIHFGSVVVHALVLGSGHLSEARFVCTTDPKAGFAWAEALADRTGLFLAQTGIPTFETSVLKSPAYFPRGHVHSQAR